MSGLNLSQKVINLFNQSIGDTALRSVVLNRVSECPSSVILCLKLPIKDILCAICRRQSNTINPFRGIEWLLEIGGSRKARSWNLQCRFQMGLEVWFWVILSLGFSILFQEFWHWGLAVSQGLEFTILYPSFWLANSFVVDCTQEAFSLFTKS